VFVVKPNVDFGNLSQFLRVASATLSYHQKHVPKKYYSFNCNPRTANTILSVATDIKPFQELWSVYKCIV